MQLDNRYKCNVLKLEPKDNFNPKHRKENLPMVKYSVIDFNTQNEVIDCRVYFDKNTTYCCLWIRTRKEFLSGSGIATGSGYNKESGSIQNACNNAGFNFDSNFSETGLQVEALEAIARYMGIANFKVYKHCN